MTKLSWWLFRQGLGLKEEMLRAGRHFLCLAPCRGPCWQAEKGGSAKWGKSEARGKQITDVLSFRNFIKHFSMTHLVTSPHI